MSLLQDILQKMYVEPELLEQLDDEQKQILFYKMREEQVRRWRQAEEDSENGSPTSDKNRRGISWLKGRDGEVWVWVMGEHPNDPTIDQIIEDEAKQRARELAEQETLILSSMKDNNLVYEDNNSAMEQLLKNQLSQIQIGDRNNKLQTQPQNTNSSPNSKYISDVKATDRSVTNGSSGSSSDQNGSANHANLKSPPPVPQKPAFLRQLEGSIKNELTPYKQPTISNSNVTSQAKTGAVPFPPAEQIPNSFDTFPNVRLRTTPKPTFIESNIQKRQSEIFEKLMEERERLQREAELEEERRRQEFEKQEQRARAAEAHIRFIAQRVRAEYQQGLNNTNPSPEAQSNGSNRTDVEPVPVENNGTSAQVTRTSQSLLPVLSKNGPTSLKEVIKRIRPPKPVNRDAIIEWYISSELPKGTGLDPKTNFPARWFHGIISRSAAEQLLTNQPSGAFLVRVSERIWGYTVSYVVKPGVTKHFLVETIPEGYQFFGTNQFVHKSLYDLVLFHETAPITKLGKEILRLAVGQSSGIQPDYSDLLDVATLNQLASTRLLATRRL